MSFKCAVINAEAEFNYSLVLILLSPSEHRAAAIAGACHATFLVSDKTKMAVMS